jgi:hypothetical protein
LSRSSKRTNSPAAVQSPKPATNPIIGRFRESEEEVHYYRRRKKKKSAQKVIDKLMDQWAPVKEMQAEAEAEEEAEARKAIERRWILKEKGYAKTRAHKHMAHLDVS